MSTDDPEICSVCGYDSWDCECPDADYEDEDEEWEEPQP